MQGSNTDRISARLRPSDIDKIDQIQYKYNLSNRSEALRYAINSSYKKDVLDMDSQTIQLPPGYCAIVVPTGDFDGAIAEKVLQSIMAQEKEEEAVPEEPITAQ